MEVWSQAAGAAVSQVCLSAACESNLNVGGTLEGGKSRAERQVGSRDPRVAGSTRPRRRVVAHRLGLGARHLGQPPVLLLRRLLLARPPGARVEEREQDQRQRGHGDRHEAVALARVHGVEHEQREQRRPEPEDQHAAALAVAQAHEPVVEVVLVGLGQARAACGPGGRWRTRCR